MSIILQFILLAQVFVSRDVAHLATGIATTTGIFVVLIIVLHFLQKDGDYLLANIINFIGLIFPVKLPDRDPNHKNILIMNWYDLKHKWGGGAEYYIHNFAKALVSEGYHVTIFCGNDGKSPRNETIDDVHIIRRGGLFSVAIWAFLYYVVYFRRVYDLVIDSAKGVPFFTPLYVKKPIIGLICHIHQEMFRKGLPFPLAQIAMYLEEKALPKIYKNTQMLTISESTKDSMRKIGLGKGKKKIAVIVPGVNIQKSDFEKTAHPSLVYVGRLRDYKNINVAIRAVSLLVPKFPNIHFTIAGVGEEQEKLEQLMRNLKIEKHITFTGYISDKQKADLFTQSWVAIHPSEVEGWGITNIEANICGTPVVATDVDGNKDSVKHGVTGLLVKVRDVESMASALEKICGDVNYRNTLIQQAIFWGNQFTWEESARQGVEIFKEYIKIKETDHVFAHLGNQIQYVKESLQRRAIQSN